MEPACSGNKSHSKEMLTIVDKPAIQYIIEEIAASGITDILVVLSRGKTAVQDHFDRSPDLERQLENGNKLPQLKAVKEVTELANITYVRQMEMKGTGNAVMCARSFVGDEPFVVVYGDDVIIGKDPATAQVCRAYETYGLGAVAMKEVPTELVLKYCSLDAKHEKDNLYTVSDMIEKPKPEQIITNFAILGRCVLLLPSFPSLNAFPPVRTVNTNSPTPCGN